MNKKSKTPKLERGPQIISEHLWYYETKDGIKVVKHLEKDGHTTGYDFNVIPWSNIAASVKRFMAVDRSKKAKSE